MQRHEAFSGELLKQRLSFRRPNAQRRRCCPGAGVARLVVVLCLVALGLSRPTDLPAALSSLATSRSASRAAPPVVPCQAASQSPLSRRQLLATGTCAGTAHWQSQAAYADVSDGDELPNGARQEDRLKRGIDAWDKMIARIKGGEVSSDEDWTNLQGFLRRLYSLQDDMNYLSRGLDPEKRAQADRLIEDFKKQVKAADKQAKAKNTAAFLPFYTETSKELEDFLDLLSDVVPEIEFEVESVIEAI